MLLHHKVSLVMSYCLFMCFFVVVDVAIDACNFSVENFLAWTEILVDTREDAFI